MAIAPAKFVREVRAEVGKVTWPSRKETLVTTGLVFAMAGVGGRVLLRRRPGDRAWRAALFGGGF